MLEELLKSEYLDNILLSQEYNIMKAWKLSDTTQAREECYYKWVALKDLHTNLVKAFTKENNSSKCKEYINNFKGIM